jgi:hypothetical protein
MENQMTKLSPARPSLADLWRTLREYLGTVGQGRTERITDRESLRQFLESRASHVAQISLYGYLRTRAGARYPELFANEDFLKSINSAKWYIWLACLSDLSIFAGGLIAHRTGSERAVVGALMVEAVETILSSTGIPVEAGAEFQALANEVRARVAACDWSQVRDDDMPFVESPAALFKWAPVFDDLKQLDEEIVRNSVRFRWQEVRRDLRRNLDADLIVKSKMPSTGT